MALFCVISANSGSFRAHCVNVHVRYLISWWVLVSSGENLAILRLHGWLMVGWSLVFAEIERKTWHFCFRSKILRIGRRHVVAFACSVDLLYRLPPLCVPLQIMLRQLTPGADRLLHDKTDETEMSRDCQSTEWMTSATDIATEEWWADRTYRHKCI